MALDSALKRFAAAGNVFPIAAKNGPWRISVGKNTYPVAELSPPIVNDQIDNTMFFMFIHNRGG